MLMTTTKREREGPKGPFVTDFGLHEFLGKKKRDPQPHTMKKERGCVNLEDVERGEM